MKLFDALSEQFRNSWFIESFSITNVSWDRAEERERTFMVENHSIEADDNYQKFLQDAYKSSLESEYDNIAIINRFDVEPIEKRPPIMKFAREVYRWFNIVVKANRGLYENMNTLVTRINRPNEIFTILFKGSTSSLHRDDVERSYKKMWSSAPNKQLIGRTDFDNKFGQKELFSFRTFLKYLHERPRMFPDVELYVRGDGTWKSMSKDKSYSTNFESWNIYLNIKNFKDESKRNTNACIDFVKYKIYSHFNSGDWNMLFKQIKMHHIQHMSVKFYIAIPTEWKDSEDSTIFFDQDVVDIPKKLQIYSGPEKVPVEFIIECANPDVYGAEVVLDEDGNWTNQHITWSLLGIVLNRFMTSENRYTPLN